MSAKRALLERRVYELLMVRKLTISVAESCTSGMLGMSLTSQSGSSTYFRGGILAYANSVKEGLLGVPASVLAEFGAVSEETACQMAVRIRGLVGSDIGLGITGIAGPGGGTLEKPVGLVYVGYADDFEVYAERLRITGDRTLIREQAVDAALEILVRRLEKEGERNG